MVEFVQYEPWHLLTIYDPRQSVPASDMEFMAVVYAQRGLGITVMADGVIIACCGIVQLWKGVGEAWTFLTDAIRSRPALLHRRTKTGLLSIAKVLGLHRVQTTVNSDDPIAIRWVERLGFIREGVRVAYGADRSDHYGYVMLKGG